MWTELSPAQENGAVTMTFLGAFVDAGSRNQAMERDTKGTRHRVAKRQSRQGPLIRNLPGIRAFLIHIKTAIPHNLIRQSQLSPLTPNLSITIETEKRLALFKGERGTRVYKSLGTLGECSTIMKLTSEIEPITVHYHYFIRNRRLPRSSGYIVLCYPDIHYLFSHCWK